MLWPQKRRLLGIDLSITDYRQAVAAICQAAGQGRGSAVAALAIHPAMLGTVCAEFGNHVNSLDLATPDGQGSRWALNWLYQAGLKDRVYGPRLMLEVVSQAARDGLPIFLYGSTPEVAARLRQSLKQQFSTLQIVGVRSPPFRALTPAEDEADLAAIRQSGARIVFVGLGCPRQEVWVCQHRHKTAAVLIAVGAAFDFLSGNKRQAPSWIQRYGLEMVFRTCMEPRRLWRRFFYFSPPFVLLVILQKFRLARFPRPGQIRILGFRILDQPTDSA
jgi:N-acetylglucosaminyldiphosphoundecaprenol N-acetyl-beta-D-mannosaminyltransferase